MKFLSELKRRFLQHMRGRYGQDELNSFLMVLFIIFVVLYSFIIREPFFWVLTMTIGVVILFRTNSKNFHSRHKENATYLELRNKLLNKFKPQNHKIYTCPNCKQKVRVPRGRGKIEITCPKCNHKFTKRT
ncbi:MAG TPA: hypothetical protein GX703_04450 [Erysipelothrix sp.]|jgi:DNA-directed RNA polymerase subunit RPC12/RpoP|nr:hypothetical protein [Erysipelothrix sp.]